MKRADEGAAVHERRGDRLEPPVFERPNERRLQGLDDDTLAVEHEHVEVNPLAEQALRLGRGRRLRGGHEQVPLFEHLGERVHVQIDATGLPILDGSQKTTKSGHLFVCSTPKHVVYHATPSKHGAHIAALLKGFKGILLADGGSELNEAVAILQLLRAACWAHARRYFFDAQAESPLLAAEAMALIGVLFEIERELKDADPETRRRRRDTDTRAALVKIHDWLTRHVQGARPRSAIGKAIQYTLNQWAALTVCADHSKIPIHNNTSELRLRQAVTGRKNYLFAGSEGGAASAAILYSLVASCRLHGLDPWAYLYDVLGRINDHPANRVIELSPAYVAGAW